MEFNMSEKPGRIFNIEKIYVKDLSLEIPGAPMVFLDIIHGSAYYVSI